MAMVVALSHTTFVGASQKSQTACRTPQFRLLRISLPIPAAPPDSTAVASSFDPIVVGGEDRSVNSPSTASEEAALLMEAVLSMYPSAE